MKTCRFDTMLEGNPFLCYTVPAMKRPRPIPRHFGETMIDENTPTILTARLLLRKFTVADSQALLELLSDQEVNTFLPWFPLQTMKEAETFLQERFLSSYHGSPGYRYAVCFKEEDRPIGYVWLANNESNDFGYALRKEHWHKGITLEAAKAVLQRIQNAGYPYITATHDVNNPRSGAVMRALGMTYQYSYVEQWQPKDVSVTFRLFQLNFDGNNAGAYRKYWDLSQNHFIEAAV